MERAPKGLYVYQPFGTAAHKNPLAPERLFGIGGFPPGVRCNGFTRDEAEAILDALNSICWMMTECCACGYHLRFGANYCPQCGAKAPAPWELPPGAQEEK